MGYETMCRAQTWAGQGAGKFQLETDEILFRAPSFRVKIVLTQISAVVARSGVLSVTTPEGVATFSIGDKAEILAEKIRSPKSRAAKMDLKPGFKVSLIGPIEASFAAELEGLGVDVSGRLRKGSNAIVFGVERPAELERLDALVAWLDSAGAIWVVHRKGKDGVKDTEVFGAGKRAGLVATKVARFSETHTVEKLVIPRSKR